MEDWLEYIFPETPVQSIEYSHWEWNELAVRHLENTFEIYFKLRNLTAEGAMVIGIVIGSGDLISRLELLLLPPLLWREDGTRIDLGARATDEFKVVEITIAPLPGSSCAGLAISTWSARLKVAIFFADEVESDEEYDLALEGANILCCLSFVEPKENPLVCICEVNEVNGGFCWGEKNCNCCEWGEGFSTSV